MLLAGSGLECCWAIYLRYRLYISPYLVDSDSDRWDGDNYRTTCPCSALTYYVRKYTSSPIECVRRLACIVNLLLCIPHPRYDWIYIHKYNHALNWHGRFPRSFSCTESSVVRFPSPSSVAFKSIWVQSPLCCVHSLRVFCRKIISSWYEIKPKHFAFFFLSLDSNLQLNYTTVRNSCFDRNWFQTTNNQQTINTVV